VVDLDVAPVSIAVADRHMSQNVLVIVVVMRVADGQVGHHPGKVAHDALHGNDMLRAKLLEKWLRYMMGKRISGQDAWVR